MTDIVKGMATAHTNGLWSGGSREAAMRAALLWLADNVSDEMMSAFAEEWAAANGSGRSAIASAIRAAAGGAE
jgi:hypothetical protein